jgi:hypothetical protein
MRYGNLQARTPINRMLTYLRFTRSEFQAIERACRGRQLSDRFFPGFKAFLVRALGGTHQELADRISGFYKWQVGIVFEYLRERRRGARLRGRGRQRDRPAGLTDAECDAVVRALAAVEAQDRFLSSYQHFLVRHFREVAPGLAKKLARLDGQQIERLHEQVRRRRRRDG